MKYFKISTKLSLLLIIFFLVGVVQGIIGGNEAEDGQFKYVVSIQRNKIHHCGGAIISDKHVLTAAHCFIGRNQLFNPDERFSIRAGITSLINNRVGDTIDIDKIYLPMGFEYSRTKNTDLLADIAVVKLQKSLKLKTNRNLMAVDIPTNTDIVINNDEKLIVSGFGYHLAEFRGRMVHITNIFDLLKFAETTLIPNDICGSRYGKEIPDTNLCAQVKQTRDYPPEGTCTGDSGSPLVLNGKTIIGILSFGPLTGDEATHPGVYTKVGSYFNFIKDAMNDIRSDHIRVASYEKYRTGMCGTKTYLKECSNNESGCCK